jgi:hypothetical protein
MFSDPLVVNSFERTSQLINKNGHLKLVKCGVTVRVDELQTLRFGEIRFEHEVGNAHMRIGNFLDRATVFVFPCYVNTHRHYVS